MQNSSVTRYITSRDVRLIGTNLPINPASSSSLSATVAVRPWGILAFDTISSRMSPCGELTNALTIFS